MEYNTFALVLEHNSNVSEFGWEHDIFSESLTTLFLVIIPKKNSNAF